MKPLKNLARYYVDLLVKLGIARFSILLALALVCFSVLLQVSVSLVLLGEIENIVIIRSVFFGLLITPWAVYFLTVVVDQLEESRQRLSSMVFKLNDMRARDRELNVELQENLRKLHQQMEEREKAEVERFEAIQDLENEVYQREKTQVELAKRTALMRSFLDASPDLIYYRNTDGEFSGCNKAFEELVGLPEKQLVGLSIYDVYSDDCTRQQVEATDAKVFLYNKELTYEIWLQYPDNKRAYFEFRKLPFYDKDNQLLGLVGFGRDITERKVYQDALVKASQDKTTFISTISHELRTPLNGIVGLSRILLDSKLNEEQRKYMQTINVSAITLGHIFNDVIDLDKFDRNELELLAVETDFHSFITDIESISGLMADQKGLRFELDQLSELPHGILVDATRLRQVLWNLVSNAMKFTKEGGVLVNVSADFDHEFAEIQFEIEDTGIGIPESEIENIFGMYYQVKSGKDNLHAVGTGIGLAVSQEITHKMGGDITVSSELGYGSTFSVSIRVPVIELSYESKPHLLSQLSLRIFIVEDIELNITVARSVLENLGHTVEVAMSGGEALAKFNPQDYDLVLLDIQLPDMTGFDIAQQLRRTYKTLPPLVALTANALKDKQTYLQGGMDGAISKPLSVKAIYKIIEQCIEGTLHNNLYLHSKAVEEGIPTVEPSENKNSAPIEVMKTEDEAESWVLDKEMLNAYIDIVGTQLVMNSVVMFEETMPNYMALLNGYLRSGDDENLVSEAHKIKGAASSVGLQRIQQLAQKVQSPKEPDWKAHVGVWVASIDGVYQSDINTLKQWLYQHS